VADFDRACAEFFWQMETAEIERWWRIMVFLTDLGSIATLAVMAVVGALWQASHRRRFLARAWLGIAISAGLLNMILKVNLDRDRPPIDWRDRAVLERNESYPSGHAMGSAVGYGMLGYVLLLQASARRHRASVVAFFAVLVALIGLSRVFLRAHWFSDVVGGYAAGLAWLFFCLACLELRRRRAVERHTNAGPS
jgi:undecaprenyl-diphosphatase